MYSIKYYLFLQNFELPHDVTVDGCDSRCEISWFLSRLICLSFNMCACSL